MPYYLLEESVCREQFSRLSPDHPLWDLFAEDSVIRLYGKKTILGMPPEPIVLFENVVFDPRHLVWRDAVLCPRHVTELEPTLGDNP